MELYYKNAEHILRIKPFNEFEKITDNIVEQLNKIVIQFTKREIQNKALQITSLIKYNVGDDWVTLIHNSKQFKRDSITLNSYIGRYGDVVGTQLHTERINTFKNSVSKNTYVKKYGKQKWQELCTSKVSFSEQRFVEKYGELLGKQKWQETLTKKLNTQRENFKNKRWKNGRTLEEYQERHGIEDGYKRWNIRNKRQSYMVSLQRYIDEFGEVIGTKMCHKLKNNTSLDSFVNRYGDEIGKERYELFCKRQSYINTYPYFVERYGSKLARNEYIKRMGPWLNSKPEVYSKISQELFWNVSVALSDELQQKIKFAELNEECKFVTNIDSYIQVDFKCGNKIIEFNGDFWHANPKQYKKNEILTHPNNHVIAEELWDNDKKRIDWLESHGYEVLIIWESDYKKDKEQIINICINFINETT